MYDGRFVGSHHGGVVPHEEEGTRAVYAQAFFPFALSGFLPIVPVLLSPVIPVHPVEDRGILAFGVSDEVTAEANIVAWMRYRVAGGVPDQNIPLSSVQHVASRPNKENIVVICE